MFELLQDENMEEDEDEMEEVDILRCYKCQISRYYIAAQSVSWQCVVRVVILYCSA